MFFLLKVLASAAPANGFFLTGGKGGGGKKKRPLSRPDQIGEVFLKIEPCLGEREGEEKEGRKGKKKKD